MYTFLCFVLKKKKKHEIEFYLVARMCDNNIVMIINWSKSTREYTCFIGNE